MLAGAGCDRGAAIFEPLETGPGVKVQLTIPAHDAIDVPLDQSIRVQFDRFLSPLSVMRQSVCIASVGPTTSGAGHAGCEQFPRPEYDPVDRVAVWKPSRLLQPGVRYTVVIRPPEEESDFDGIRAFDGAPLESAYVFAFTTERRSPCAEDSDCAEPARCACQDIECGKKACQLPSREPKRSIDYCYEAPELCTLTDDGCLPPRRMPMTTAGPREQLHGCAGDSARCHGGDAEDGFGPRGARLSLAKDGIRDFIGKVALQTATSSNPLATNRQGYPFGVNMPVIDPGFSANSYLLWKLVLALDGKDASVAASVYPQDGYRCEDLEKRDENCPPPLPPLVRAGERQAGPVEPWIPEELSMPIAEGEYERLRRALFGSAMPFGPNAHIDPAQIRTISAWIAAGAPVTDCP